MDNHIEEMRQLIQNGEPLSSTAAQFGYTPDEAKQALGLLDLDDLKASARIARPQTLEKALASADYLNDLAEKLGAPADTFMPVDRGAAVSPRYAVYVTPRIGDEVSEAFNGDSYPCGRIIDITPSMNKITASASYVRDGYTTFTRRKPYKASIKHSGVWMVRGSNVYTMVPGHAARRNQEF